MKIAISSTGKDLESEVDVRFGRCSYFIIVEIEGKEIKSNKAIENTAMMQGSGAGITAAQVVGNEDVDAVIGINLGPRAFSVLEQLGIEIYQGIQGTVKENVQQFVEGKLLKLTGATGPMGMGPRPGVGMGAGRGMGRGQGLGRS